MNNKTIIFNYLGFKGVAEQVVQFSKFLSGLPTSEVCVKCDKPRNLLLYVASKLDNVNPWIKRKWSNDDF